MLSETWWKKIPVPTVEQTASFSEHVINNHSWYKHLPFFPPGASFVFFPNPHAGSGIKSKGDRFTIYNIKSGSVLAHHSRLSTAEYVARFGHWDYWADSESQVNDSERGPWLYDADSKKRELLADTLKLQWSCRLTAFLKPAPFLFGFEADELLDELESYLESWRRPLGKSQSNLSSRDEDTHPDDRVLDRYRAAAERIRLAVAQDSDTASREFIESEIAAQREILQATLRRVRTAWLA